MNRRELLACLGALGLLGVSGCKEGARYADLDVRFTGRVVIVGAGAAGLAAAYLLERYGIDTLVLEASDRIGGRVREHTALADVPLDLGAEWLHQGPTMLPRLIDDPTVSATVDVVPYSPDTIESYSDGTFRSHNAFGAFYTEHKFASTTWFSFVDDFLAPASRGRVQLGRPVVAIDTTGERVRVEDADGGVEECDAVVVTVPLKVLQDGLITFTPPLPSARRDAIEAVTIADGLKVFLRFSERFYADLTAMGHPLDEGTFDKLYYDATFLKDTEHHVLALFWVAPEARAFTDLSDDAILSAVVAELDEMFEGAASAHLLDGVVMNWSAEPWIRGAYSYAWDGDYDAIVSELATPVPPLFFAGAYSSVPDNSTVPGAILTAFKAVRMLLEG